MMENKNTIWMPIQEYEQLKKLNSELTIEQKNRMSYFFWNNFSYDGYEEWKVKSIKEQENENR